MAKRSTKVVERPVPKFDPMFADIPWEVIQDDRGRVIGEVYRLPPGYDRREREFENKGTNKRQRETLEFIREFIAKKGISPSLAEIGKGINLSSKSTTHGIITRLQERGYITQEAKLPRPIRVTGQEDELSRLRNRVAELEALLQQRPDIATINGHDEKLAAVLDELKAVGI